MLALCLQPVCFAFIMPYNFLFKARHDISGKRTEVYTVLLWCFMFNWRRVRLCFLFYCSWCHRLKFPLFSFFGLPYCLWLSLENTSLMEAENCSFSICNPLSMGLGEVVVRYEGVEKHSIILWLDLCLLLAVSSGLWLSQLLLSLFPPETRFLILLDSWFFKIL